MGHLDHVAIDVNKSDVRVMIIFIFGGGGSKGRGFERE